MNAVKKHTLVINHVEYDLVFEDSPEIEMSDGERAGIHGAFSVATQEITLSRDLPPAMRCIVLLHELLHGLMTHCGLSDHSEELIDGLSYGLYGLLRDNPELMDWIQRGNVPSDDDE